MGKDHKLGGKGSLSVKFDLWGVGVEGGKGLKELIIFLSICLLQSSFIVTIIRLNLRFLVYIKYCILYFNTPNFLHCEYKPL